MDGSGQQPGLFLYEGRVVGERAHGVASVGRRCLYGRSVRTRGDELSQHFFDSVETAVVVGRSVGFQVECLRRGVLDKGPRKSQNVLT